MESLSPKPGTASSGLGGGTRKRLRLGAVSGVVMVVMMCTAAPALAASPPTTPGRVTFGIEPASALGADGRPHFSFGVTPGATLFDHVAAVNYSTVPLALQLYPTDAVETAGGGFGLLPADVKPTGAGSWISLAAADATVVVPARSATGPGQVVVPLTVHIPDRATPGDHVGGIIASLQTEGTNASGQKVVLDQRIGTRVFIRVSGLLAPRLALTHEHTSYQATPNPVGSGRVKVSYVVRNTGNVDLVVDHQSVSVSGLIGSTRRVPVANIALLLPGASVAESAIVPRVWPEFFVHESETAQPLASSGTVAVPLASVTAGTGLWAIPWTLLGIIVLIVVLAWAWARRRARRTARIPVGRTPEVAV